MGKTIRDAAGYNTSSSDFTDDEQPELDAARYHKADMQQGLTTRQYRLSAVNELREVMTQGYTSAPKKLQSLVFEDLLVAVRQPDSRPVVAEAMSQLVAAAKRVLPQQKRNQLLKEQRQAAVAANRAARRHEGTAVDSFNDEPGEDAVVLGDVPLEVVQGFLQALDPASLARAACVCRSWHELATGDELWQQRLQDTFPTIVRQPQHCSSSQQQQQHRCSSTRGVMTINLQSACNSCGHSSSCHAAGHEVHKQFAAAAVRHPAAVLPWRSCRVLASGRLQWLPPGSMRPCTPGAVKAARRGVISAGPVYVTTAQAVRWLLGSSRTAVFTADDDRSSSGGSSDVDSSSGPSDGEESHLHDSRTAAKALRLWAIRG